MPGLTWPECVGSSWMIKALMPLTGPYVPQTWIVMYLCIHRHQVAPQTVQELTDALILVWKEIHPQDTIHHLIRSRPRRCQECTQARGGHTHYWATLWVVVMKFTQVGSACDLDFSLFSGGDFESSHQWVNDFGFHRPFLHHFVLNELYNLYQWRFLAWIFHSSRWEVWYECSLNCFEQSMYLQQCLFIFHNLVHCIVVYALQFCKALAINILCYGMPIKHYWTAINWKRGRGRTHEENNLMNAILIMWLVLTH